MEASSSSSKLPESSESKKPVVIITIGMAGSGKTTFVQRMNSYLHSLDREHPPYIVNLDPAVSNVPFDTNIDIRDTINYAEVMKQYVYYLLKCACVLSFFHRKDTILALTVEY